MWAGEHFSQLSTLTRRAMMNCIVMNTTEGVANGKIRDSPRRRDPS